ncbi:calcium-activated potassium channel subunit beta-3 [Exaiptasia diaphana]|uniref:Uncharacterized protein n=1 Tax=Exaiptasia diaphana TaxID=2652724 RepID=A0A913XNL8_EXADI|nr:calcium-activated potassium channel subunit beta-3 [Exaiptasia diaphana]KXJ10240.1 Calcium-activated potassium channel subunit beta-3 [Exaiptasia diaphana]
MNRQKSVKIADFKYHKSSEKLSLHCGMANVKYSHVLWALFGVFLLAVWIGLYVGYVLPVQNSFMYKETQCTITRGILLPSESVQQCPCTSSPCPDPPKKYPCVQIFVNYTIPQQRVKHSLLHYSEAVTGNNCSYVPYCKQSQAAISLEVNYYFSLRSRPNLSIKCYYNKYKDNEVIDVNYSSERLAILVPFAVVLLLLLCVFSFILYRRGCGCNAKRRPSRLSFLSNMDE